MKNKILFLTTIIVTAASINGMQQATVDDDLQAQLFEASRGKHEKIASIVAAGADVNHIDNHGATALMFASSLGYDESTRCLLDARADVNQQDGYQQTALMNAVDHGHVACVRVLTHAKADVNLADWRGNTALMQAARLGYRPESVRLLINANAHVNVKNRKGDTALSIAAMEGLEESCDPLSGNKGKWHEIVCDLLVDRALCTPNTQQGLSINAYFRRLRRLPGYCRNIKTVLLRTFQPIIYCQNRNNFAQSTAAQAVAALPEGIIKTALLKKYAISQEQASK